MSHVRYTAPHMLLHWVVAALVGLQILFADAMGAAFDAKFENIEIGSAWTIGAAFHALVGASIGLLMLWRLALRVTTDIPPPAPAPAAIRTLARLSHWLFYGILIGMPLIGALAWFMPSLALGTLHDTAGKALLVLIALHLCGAVYHHLIAGDRTVLRRMLPR